MAAEKGGTLLGYEGLIPPKMSGHDLLIFGRALDGLPPLELSRTEKSPNASSPWHSGEHSFAVHAMSRHKRKKAGLNG